MAVRAARVRRMTAQEWADRALELAREQHLLYRSHYCGANEAAEQVFTVPSKCQPHTVYMQRINPHTGTTKCDCKASAWGMPCGHIGAAIHCWSQIAYAMTEAAAQANQRYHEFAEFLETRGY